MEKLIEVRNASFAYRGGDYIWKDLNLTVHAGDSVCILGANGCGKTTLFNCITGGFPLSRGMICIDGRDILDYSVTELAQTVGIVYQEHTVSFPYTALEVVRMGRTPYLGVFQTPSARDTEMAYGIMEEIGIRDLADKSYGRISGGQRQLVLIARTLCQNPRALLLDEPTSHLDFKNQAVVMKTLKGLSEKGMTIVMTSHSPAHAWQISNRAVLMGKGGLIAEGAPEQIMTEKNLEETYGVKVKIHTAHENGKTLFFCEPDLA